MDERMSIVIPMKVWTPGLHGFRSKHMHSARAMMPAHIRLFALSRSDRENPEERLRSTNRLNVLCQSISTFSYSLSKLGWIEDGKILYLEPEPVEPFVELREAIREKLELEKDYRDVHKMRLALAIGSELSQYALVEEFQMMVGDLLPLKCRATELEIYRRNKGDWLLSESIPFRESGEN